MGYTQNRQLSDKYLPHAKTILSQILIAESSYEEDTQHATDLIVLTAGGTGKIACRFRQSEYFYKPKHPEYRQQFTVRSRLDSGRETEFSKIMSGFCDLMLYGFMADDEKRLEIDWWVLVSLHAFRAQIDNPCVLYEDKDNHDGTFFRAFDLTTFDRTPPLIYRTNIPELLPFESNEYYEPPKALAQTTPTQGQTRSDIAMQMLYKIAESTEKAVENTEMLKMAFGVMKARVEALERSVPRQASLFR